VRTWFTNKLDSWLPAARAWNLCGIDDGACSQNPQAAALQGGSYTGTVLYYTHTPARDKQPFSCQAFALLQESSYMYTLRPLTMHPNAKGTSRLECPLDIGRLRTGLHMKFALSRQRLAAPG